jgi:hypothetical protein
MLLRSLSIAMSLIALAGSGAAAHDAGLVPVAGDAGSAARLAAVFGTVTSIHRTVERNRLVGGVPNSFHLSGRAIDVARRPGVTHDQIAAALRRAGYNLVHYFRGLPRARQGQPGPRRETQGGEPGARGRSRHADPGCPRRNPAVGRDEYGQITRKKKAPAFSTGAPSFLRYPIIGG